MTRIFTFTAFIVFFSLVSVSHAQHQDKHWDFAKDTQKWHKWGTPQAPTAAQRGKLRTAVIWDAKQGCHAKGALKITDNDDAMGIYAVTPMLRLQKKKDKSVDKSIDYHFTGKVRWDKNKPRIFMLFFEKEGKHPKFKGIREASSDATSSADDSGWASFEMIVQGGRIPKKATYVRLAVCPSPTHKDRNAFEGTVWLDDVSWYTGEGTPLSLLPYMNRGLSDGADSIRGWTNQGNKDMRGLTARKMIVQGVSFMLADPAANKNRAVIALGYNGPEHFTQQVDVAIKSLYFDHLYLLHTAASDKKPPKAPIGFVDFHYDNGDVLSAPLHNGRDISDRSGNGTVVTAYSVPVKKPNTGTVQAMLYASEIPNPQPQLRVKNLTFRAGQKKTIWLIFAANLSTGPSRFKLAQLSNRDMSDWQPFMPALARTASDSVDLSFLLDPPAGKHGVLQISDEGHFHFEDGTPARFWGTNIHCNQGAFPTHEQAEIIAQTLARYGCNIVRFHLPESSMIRTDLPNAQTWVDDDLLDRFDYFVKCLKDRGIYIMLDSLAGVSGRKFKPADGVVAGEKYFQHRSWAYYDSRLRELARDFMRQYLTHTNPYTGHTLATEPAVAMGLLINEQSVFRDRPLDSQPEHYRKQLKKQYNQWLLKRFHDRAGLLKAWQLPDGSSALKNSEDPAHGTVELICDFVAGGRIRHTLAKATDPNASSAEQIRAAENVRFFQYLQTQYALDLIAWARELDARFPIFCTNGYADLAELQTTVPLRMAAQNTYWDHVHQDHTNGLFTLTNEPMVSSNPLSGTVLSNTSILNRRIVNSIIISTETNTMWPNDWRSSHMILNAAYGAHGRVDGLLQYAFTGGWGYDWNRYFRAKSILRPSQQFNDPAMISSFIAGAFLYLRGDVAPAISVVRIKTPERMTLIADGTNRLSHVPFPGNYVPYVSRLERIFPGQHVSGLKGPGIVMTDSMDYRSGNDQPRIIALDKRLKSEGVIPPDAGIFEGRLVSDTLQIVRDWKKQYVLIDTPLSQGCTGFVGKQTLMFKDISIRCQTPFATLLVSSLDNQPLSSAKRMFLVAVARAENEDNKGKKLRFASYKTTPQGIQRGLYMTIGMTINKGPVSIEPVVTEIDLKAKKVAVTPLNPDMSPKHAARRVFKEHQGVTTLQLGEKDVSAWYLVERLP